MVFLLPLLRYLLQLILLWVVFTLLIILILNLFCKCQLNNHQDLKFQLKSLIKNNSFKNMQNQKRNNQLNSQKKRWKFMIKNKAMVMKLTLLTNFQLMRIFTKIKIKIKIMIKKRKRKKMTNKKNTTKDRRIKIEVDLMIL